MCGKRFVKLGAILNGCKDIKNNFTTLQGVGGGIFSCTRIWVFACRTGAFAMWFGGMAGGLAWLGLVRFTRLIWFWGAGWLAVWMVFSGSTQVCPPYDVVFVISGFSHLHRSVKRVLLDFGMRAVAAAIACALFLFMRRGIYRIMKSDKKKPTIDQPTDLQKADQDPDVPVLGEGSPPEFCGPKGPEPTRYGDWEQKGRVQIFDFSADLGCHIWHIAVFWH